MGNPFKKDKPSAPTPVTEPEPVKAEVAAARTQAKEAVTPIGRRRGNLGRISSLLSGGYRGFGTEDKLG